MSAKWRALQYRHRYTYSAVIFPSYFIEALNQKPNDESCSNYYSELKELISLNSTYSQVNHVKRVASGLENLLKTCQDEGLVSEAVKFYLEILFFENSVPLHRTLVSVLVKNNNFQSLIRDCFRLLCEEYGGLDGKGKRFGLSRVALSMLSSPKLGYLVDIVEECAVLMGLDIVLGLNGVVSEIDDWSRPSPLVMEQCQEALSCMYYLLQRFPLKFSDFDGCGSLIPEHSNILEMIMTTILKILKSAAFSRDCFVAAGVTFCAALQVCLSPEELGFAIMKGVFYQKVIMTPGIDFMEVIRKVPYKGDLLSDIQIFSVLSRLCLIRGIVTAVSRTVLNTHFIVTRYDMNGFRTIEDSNNSLRTILYDGILPELCNYCENPSDSHFNFHALTVMQICLQQIKTLLQANFHDTVENYVPISEDMGTRILQIIWNNLEDPLSQTVKQVHLIFDLFLEIQSTLHWADGNERSKFFLQKIASDLLQLGPRCKGRYVPLASLTKRLGAKTILDMNPELLFETTKAYIDDDVCCAATTFLKCYLERLRDEFWSSDGIGCGYSKYRSHSLPPFLYGLASGVSKLRSNLNTYALPVLLEIDVDGIFPMLAFVGVGKDEHDIDFVYSQLSCTFVSLTLEQQVAILVSLLKVSRSLALIEGAIDWAENSLVFDKDTRLKTERNCYAFVCIKGINVKILVSWLVLALTNVDESLRIDASESLFLNPKTASLPSSLELSLLKEAVPLNMRCCSTAFQMKWASLFRKFFSRVRTALERQIKQGSWKPLAFGCNNEVYHCKGTERTVAYRAEDLFHFMRWLSCFLFFSCYPSAPYERKIMSMDLILIIINVWAIVTPLVERSNSFCSELTLNPYSKGFTLPDSTLLLVGSIIDSWDRLRESSFRILLHFPTPLPGISSPDMIRKVILWSKKLVCSPRVRESDAGALTLRLIFRKYVLELGWIVRPCNAVSFHPESELQNGDYTDCTLGSPATEYVTSLIGWLNVVVDLGEKDLYEACKNSFVHGVLLTLRYTFEELDWNSDVVLCSISDMKCALEKLLELITRITSLALCVVSADAWYLPDDMDDMVGDDPFSLEVPVDVKAYVPSSGNTVKDVKFAHDNRHSEQIVMVGCWLAMKEVSLLLGTVIRKIPLTTSDTVKSEFPVADTANVSVITSYVMLDLKQLERIGNHFLEVLLKMKHNGAIDKTRAGFTALCNRLLCSNDPRLCKLTESWMDQLMERTVAKGQTVDDLLRRSAGIPAAFTAFFLSEPEGTPKRLLPRALRWLIDVAKKPINDQAESSEEYLCNVSSTGSCTLLSEMDVKGSISKIRDEGVIPTVHAFNVLRAAFNDTNLATDTSGFSAEALIISIRSFSSSYWEVRNSACLSYTALVRRILGFLNVQKRESARRALTGLEFFRRYPSLHRFLLNELEVATEMHRHGSSERLESNLANVVHPSLCPMLILLSRLKPSAISSELGDALDPFLLMPFIRKCSIQSNLRVRVLASRALTGLVSNEKLGTVLLNIAVGLPCLNNWIASGPSLSSPANDTPCTFNSIHGMLLQLNSLLDTNCRNLADLSKKDEILNGLIQVLVACSWIGSPRSCPCPIVNGCFLMVLDNMLSIARTCQLSRSIDAILNLLWELSSECLDLKISSRRAYYDPTIVELRRQAARSYFNCVFHVDKEVAEEELPMPCTPSSFTSKSFNTSEMDISRFQENLIFAMSDMSYEVRIAALKWLFLFLKAKKYGSEYSDNSCCEVSIFHWMNTELHATLIELLEVEKNHKCAYYILKILFTWNLLQYKKQSKQQYLETRFVGNMDADSLFQFWDKLIFLYKGTRPAKTRETVICCMGVCVKQFTTMLTGSVHNDTEDRMTELSQLDQSDKFSHLYNCISYYVNIIELHSDSPEPVNMRRAAADSMVASGLLKQAELIGSTVINNYIPSGNPFTQSEQKDSINKYAHRILDIWLTCIKLLEDEDVELRKGLAMDVQKSFYSKSYIGTSQDGAVPRQVEKVIELSFEHLSAIFGHWIDYFNYLSCWVLSTVNCVVYVGDLVRRVFDKEIDNHHEEKLLICQICCSHLEKLPISKSWATDLSNKGLVEFLCEWRMRFYQQLISFVSDHIGKKNEVDWLGGVGNHKDAFLPLYGNLLGFYALSNCISFRKPENIQALLSDVVQLGKVIQPFLRNPLISNLYLLVVKSHDKMVGPTTDHLINSTTGDDSLWDAFDPYFLLG